MGQSRGIAVTVSVPLSPDDAFAAVVEDLRDGLSVRGITLDPRVGGRLTQLGDLVGEISAWNVGRTISIAWHPASWKPEETTQIELRFEPESDGTRITLELGGWGGLFTDAGADLAGWFGSGVAAPLLQAISPEGVGDWLTDRTVRRPSGPRSRATYADPTFHWPNFLLILERIGLRSDDLLLEVGCGGGAFMHKALESGCRATAIDHSPEMVRLTRAQNREAVASGDLTVLEAEADRLPVPDGTFTCAVMTGVIGFLPDPVAALREIRRALRPGGRIAVFGSTAALRGTPAAPEPFASRIRFFDRAEFEQLGRNAGFVEVVVEEPDLAPYARAAKLPDEARKAFDGLGGALLLMARRA